MGNLFSGGNTKNHDFSNFDISSLNLSDDDLMGGGGGNTRYNQYDIFKIIADMEKENGMSGGGKKNGFSDTITNYDEMINQIRNSVLSKKKQLRGGGCEKCKLGNSLECGCNKVTSTIPFSGGEANGIGYTDELRKQLNTTLDAKNFSQTSSVDVKQKMNGGKKSKKSKKTKKYNSSSLSITSSSSSTSSHSSNSVSSSSSSSSKEDSQNKSSEGGSDNKLSIFPFNSTTNSVSEKNFRLLRRRL